MRQAKLSGIYYKGAPTLLDQQITACFQHEKGPGEVPIKPKSEKLNENMGIIVPRYQYDLAGPCAAWAYKELAEAGTPDVLIILSQTHLDYSGFTTEPYETPYGIVRVDQVFARALAERKHIKEHKAMFDEDETVESQLPFIQFCFKKNLEGLKIMPIILSTDVDFKELAVDIKEVLLEQNKTAAIIVPTNFTYFGTNHGYVPFSSDEVKKVGELDKEALELIQSGDVGEYLKYVEENTMNTDNYLGIVLAQLILKPTKYDFEQYYLTAELNHDYKNFISFAAMIMR